MGNQYSFQKAPNGNVNAGAYYNLKKISTGGSDCEKEPSQRSQSNESEEDVSEGIADQSDLGEPEAVGVYEKEDKSGKPVADCWVGLSTNEARSVSEKIIQKAFRNAHKSFVAATPVTNVAKERTLVNGIFLENVQDTYSFSQEQLVYDIPLDYVGLRVAKGRTSRSKIDPWRRHGAFAKICEIGGHIPETKQKGVKARTFITIKPGTTPPPAPKTAPLTKIEEYMTFKQDKSKSASNSDL